jgi:enamine deaminase RidA (YjgF/YER057c/UK114 family)
MMVIFLSSIPQPGVNSMIKGINAGSGYPGVSMGTLVSEGTLLFLSGHVGTDEAGEPVTGGFEAQVQAAFENMGKTLAAAGVGFEALAKMTTYITDPSPESLAAFKKVRNSFVNMDCPPANALVTVAGLYDPAIKIEIEGVALIPR